MSSSATFRQGIYQSEFARKIARWLEAMPHPPLALEISQDRVAAARWTRTGGLDSYAIEALPNGALMPSAVESNIVDLTAVKGAIAGVMGAYFVLYPKARVMMWFPPIFFFHLPAWLVLGYWFFMQFLSGAATSIAETSQTNGGIAFWAHVGGFVAGVVLIKVLPARPRRYRYAAW